MKLIKPSWEILEQSPGIEGIYEAIERAGRTCYKSQRKEGTTAKDFVDRMIASQHYAMLEHGTVYLKVVEDLTIESLIDRYRYNKYSVVSRGRDKCSFHGETAYLGNICITTNYRVLVENGWLDDLKYLCEPTKYHEKRVTVKFTTSNGIMREFTRHRSHSFAVESTRYCNYSKDKFNNELTFIQPFWVKEEMPLEEASRYILFRGLLECAETTYLEMIESGMKPQEAREVLPLATKCDMVMTGFVSDWAHLFRLRTSFLAETGKPHPDMTNLCDPLYKEFVNRELMESLI